MRNIFDQYNQPENRLTHALVCCLFEDRKLLNSFISWVLATKPKIKNVQIVEQRLPGEQESSEEDSERRGLPDAWIYDDESWSLIIESKVAAQLKNEQLQRHLKTAQKRGFINVTLLAIDVVEPKRNLPSGVLFRKWSDIYIWLSKQADYSDWAKKLMQYMEIAESKWPAETYLKEGTLTKFSGIPFNEDNPYNYLEAKRVLKLAMEELRQNQKLSKELGVDLKAKGRSAITGKAHSSVWDYLSLKKAKGEDSFTAYPHFTLSIANDRVFVLVTMPNGIKREFKNNLLDGGVDKFHSTFKKIYKRFSRITDKVEGAIPWVEVLQRHYKTQKSIPKIDARLAFDLRTAFPDENSGVKKQSLWLEAAYDAVAKKRANTQLAIGIVFQYSACQKLQTASIIRTFADTWVACKPLIESLVKK